MKLLYIGDLEETGTSAHRMQALERLGFTVRGLDTQPYASAGGRLGVRMRLLLLAGPTIDRLNRAILAAAADFDPAFIWFDKPLFVRPDTLQTLKRQGRPLINYICDNPFSPLPREHGWRLARRTIPLFDLCLVPRAVSVADFHAAGAARVALMPFAFEPWSHYPPPPDTVRQDIAVSFIGSPHGDRPAFMARLAALGHPVTVRGPRWQNHRRIAGPSLRLGPPALGDAYREAIWQARVNLGMVTHGHRDPWGHRAFEITAAGGFLLGERTEGHVACFAEGKEAEFFDSVEEAADKAAFYLAHDSARTAIAAAGCRRAWMDGYGNDERLAAAIGVLDPPLGARLMDTARRTIARRRDTLGIA